MNYARRYYFLKIAETRNLTRAAQQLMVSQPSLTQYLNKLEQELEVELVDRHFTPLRLTEAGQVYEAYLRDALQREQQLRKDLEHYRPEKRGVLRVGLPLQKSPDMTRIILPRFLRDYPNVELNIWEGTSQTVRERIVKGELEIGFGYSQGDADKFCVAQPIDRERVLLVCHRENPLVAGRENSRSKPCRVDPAQLRDQIFFQMSPEYYLHSLQVRHMQRHGADPVRRVTMSNLYGILSSIAASPASGFAYIPDYIFEESNVQDILPSLAFFHLGGEDLSWQFSMLRRKGKKLTREGRAFWNCVLEETLGRR